MRRLLAFLILFAGLVPGVYGQSRLKHWASHHKELLVSDAVTFLAYTTDASSSVACQREKPAACTETLTTIGKHPSAFATFGYAWGFAGAQIGLAHLMWWGADGDEEKHMIWLGTGAIVGIVIPTAYNNISIATQKDPLAEARARVMR